MSLTHTCLRVAVRVIQYYNSVPLAGAMPVMAPVRGRSNHQFTAGHDSCKFSKEGLFRKKSSGRMSICFERNEKLC